MKYSNPFSDDWIYENDIEDFQMPYRLYGSTDKEVMLDKYKKLRNTSYGYIVRFASVMR